MDSNQNLPPVTTFAAEDLDIDMIDKIHTPVNGASAAAPAASLADMARQLAGGVDALTRRLQDREERIQQLEQQLRAYDDNARAYEALKSTLREVAASELTVEDVQQMQRVLQALEKDPNHIMVLASVAQQATKLQIAVNGFARIFGALKQAPPR